MDVSEKKKIRKYYKEKRDHLSAEQVNSYSEDICKHVIQLQVFRKTEYIFAYYPLGNEADIRAIIEKAWSLGKRVAFPKVFGDMMRFFEISDFSSLHSGTFGVMEPEEKNPVSWSTPLVLVPGVAFDLNGGRMGFGKGYYDKYLASIPTCITMGISYDFQITDELPMEPTDVALDYIISERRCIKT